MQWLAGLSLVGLAVATFASLLVASLIGYGFRRLERRLTVRAEEPEHSQESYLVGGMIGLMALLLAFSFSIALERFDERRHLVVQEANAIGTSYLRAQMLDEPHRSRLSSLLVAYTDNRIRLASIPPDQLTTQLAINDKLLVDIWSAVTAARDSALAHGISVPLLNTFNEVIDLDTERKISRTVRMPSEVLELLLGFLLLTALVLGYVLEERRGRIGALVLFVLLSLYIGIIADLNRPSSGRIKEAQDAMLMLQASLKSQPPHAFDRYLNGAVQ
ncbi:hypothetical protein LZ496_05840 [Sphingomonas sp. NSE70-1]|uniref:DUF4239 domain-containing protein n=1 Tax=Sphingomonas caseinilyticus TaxID=2908205 RepID=A0ABT0RTI6_9SPHN|nr:hypothetical protein [Sphingomonas caseinilyticus]MCL6698302.1 hypothetical protein [Sphingomonas caseinilyticus]